jgi:hypothetical protein
MMVLVAEATGPLVEAASSPELEVVGVETSLVQVEVGSVPVVVEILRGEVVSLPEQAVEEISQVVVESSLEPMEVESGPVAAESSLELVAVESVLVPVEVEIGLVAAARSPEVVAVESVLELVAEGISPVVEVS